MPFTAPADEVLDRPQGFAAPDDEIVQSGWTAPADEVVKPVPFKQNPFTPVGLRADFSGPAQLPDFTESPEYASDDTMVPYKPGSNIWQDLQNRQDSKQLTPGDLVIAKDAKLAQTPDQEQRLWRAVADANTPNLPVSGTAGQLATAVSSPPTPFTDMAGIWRQIQQNNRDTTLAMRQMAQHAGLDPDTAARLPPLWEQYLQGTANAGLDLGLSFTSPAALGALGLEALPKGVQRTASLGFSAQMLSDLPEQVRQLAEEENKPEGERDDAKIAQLYFGTLFGSGLGTMAAAHGVLPGVTVDDFARPPKPAPTPSPAPETAPSPSTPLGTGDLLNNGKPMPVSKGFIAPPDEVTGAGASGAAGGQLPGGMTDDSAKPVAPQNQTAPPVAPMPVETKLANLKAMVADLEEAIKGNQLAPPSEPAPVPEGDTISGVEDRAPIDTSSEPNPPVIPDTEPSTPDAGTTVPPAPAASPATEDPGPPGLPSWLPADWTPPVLAPDVPHNMVVANIGETGRPGLNAQWLEANTGDLRAALPGAPEVKIVQSAKDLPELERNQAADMAAEGKQVRAMLSDDYKIYLIADHISDIRTAREIYLEETLGHAGMEPMVKPGEVDRLFDLIWRGAQEEAAEIARTYGHDLRSPSGRADFVGEFVAKASHWFLQKPSLYRRVADFLRRIAYRVKWLRNIAPSQVLDATMRGLARRAAARLGEKSDRDPYPRRQTRNDIAKGTSQRNLSTPPKFSLADDAKGSAQQVSVAPKPRAKLLDVRRNNAEISASAAKEFASWPEYVKAADGSHILLKNPENGSLGQRVKHLLWDDERSQLHKGKASWIPNVPDTLANADMRLRDPETGNRLYARTYQDGTHHMVIVRPDGTVEDQKPFTGKLITQFPSDAHGRQAGFPVEWKR